MFGDFAGIFGPETVLFSLPSCEELSCPSKIRQISEKFTFPHNKKHILKPQKMEIWFRWSFPDFISVVIF